MSISFEPCEAAAVTQTTNQRYGLVDHWYETPIREFDTDHSSVERQTLRAKAEEAFRRARPFADSVWTPDAVMDAEYVLPPIMIERSVQAKFRRVVSIPPVVLDEDDLPL